jgi:regulator of sigma E protease
LPGTRVELTFSREDQRQTVTLTPVEIADWFNPDRGLLFEPMTFHRKARSAAEAVAQGGRETLEDLTIVFRTVKKLGGGEISMRLMGGPVSIFWMAIQAADAGMAKFLLFLTLLSANLAVLNFLPIPVLDGGLFVLLVYEGIRGKPADERVQAALSYLGLILIIALMVWVFGLDLRLISRR